MLNTDKEPKVGDVFMVNFCGDYNEQNGSRPGVIFQNNTGNKYSPNVIVLPMTSQVKKLNQPTHVFLNASSSGLKKDSVVLCENPECVSKNKLGKYVTSLNADNMEEIAIACMVATSAIAFVQPRNLELARQKAMRLNVI